MLVGHKVLDFFIGGGGDGDGGGGGGGGGSGLWVRSMGALYQLAVGEHKSLLYCMWTLGHAVCFCDDDVDGTF